MCSKEDKITVPPLKASGHRGRRVRGQDVRRRRATRRQRERPVGEDGAEDGGGPRQGAHGGNIDHKTGLINAFKMYS